MAPRGIRCGLAEHKLSEDFVKITEPKHLRFVRLRIKDFREDYKVCRKCRDTMLVAFNIKYQRAISGYKENKLKSLSLSLSQSRAQETTSNSQEIPVHVPKKRALELSVSTSSNSSVGVSTVATVRNNLIDEEDDESDDYVPSPNALNNKVRLPHVQPIIKRRPRPIGNSDIMDAYLRGIIGG